MIWSYGGYLRILDSEVHVEDHKFSYKLDEK